MKKLLLVCLLALIPRMLLWLQAASTPECFLMTDSLEYQSLATTSGWLLPEAGAAVPELSLRRTPVYPLLAGAVFSLGGPGLQGFLLLQIGLSVLTVWLVGRLAGRAFGEGAGLAAAVLIAFNPLSISYANLFLTETLFALLVFSAVALVAQSRAEPLPSEGLGTSSKAGGPAFGETRDQLEGRRASLRGDSESPRTPSAHPSEGLGTSSKAGGPAFGGTRSHLGGPRLFQLILLFLAGLCLGLAILTRPIALYLPWVLILFLLWRRTLLGALLLWLGCNLPVGAWMLRNHSVTGVWLLSSIEGASFLHYRAAGAIAEETGRRIEDVRAELEARELELGWDRLDPARRSEQRKRLGLSLLREHPWGALKSSLKGLWRTVAGPGQQSMQNLLGPRFPWLRTPLLAYQVLWTLLVYGAVLWGLRAWRTSDSTLIGLCVAAALYFYLVSAGPEAYARFRAPIVPFLSVLGGLSLAARPGSRA